MAAPECQKPPGSTWSTCLEYLADGWTSPSYLCPACTRAFMSALDSISGPLAWHRGYRNRASE